MSRVSIEDAMGHNISWDNEEKTVVLQEYTDGAAKDDLYQLAQKSAQMLQTVAHTVHLIIDERRIDLVLNPSDMRYLDKLTPKNQGTLVLVVQPAKIKYKMAAHHLGAQIGPNAFGEPYFADTIEAARQLLQESFGVRYESTTPEESSDPPII
jgi:hypothetical protein